MGLHDVQSLFVFIVVVVVVVVRHGRGSIFHNPTQTIILSTQPNIRTFITQPNPSTNCHLSHSNASKMSSKHNIMYYQRSRDFRDNRAT